MHLVVTVLTVGSVLRVNISGNCTRNENVPAIRLSETMAQI